MLSSSRLPCRAEVVPRQLSLRGAVAAAVASNARIKASKEESLSAQSDLRIAGFTTSYGIGTEAYIERTRSDSQRNSRVIGGFAYEGLQGTTASLDLSPLGFGENRGFVALELRRPLIKGRGILSDKANLVAGARSYAAVQDEQLYLTRQGTVRGVVQAYYRAVLERDQVEVQKRAVEIAEIAADGARKREKEQLIVALDVTRADIQVAQTKDALNRQEQAARAAMDTLMLAIGSGVGETAELTDLLPEEDMDPPSLSEAIKIALANRPELTVYDYQLSDQERQIKYLNDQLRPGLDAVVGFDSTNNDSGLLTQSLLRQGLLTVGFEYRFPLDKRIDIEKRDTAKRQIDVIREQRAYETEQIAQEVRSAFRVLESARTSLRIQTDNLKVAEEKLNLAERAVDEGLQDNRDVLEAQAEITQISRGILEAQTELYLAGVDLKYYMGEDLTRIGAK